MDLGISSDQMVMKAMGAEELTQGESGDWENRQPGKSPKDPPPMVGGTEGH